MPGRLGDSQAAARESDYNEVLDIGIKAKIPGCRPSKN